MLQFSFQLTVACCHLLHILCSYTTNEGSWWGKSLLWTAAELNLPWNNCAETVINCVAPPQEPDRLPSRRCAASPGNDVIRVPSVLLCLIGDCLYLFRLADVGQTVPKSTQKKTTLQNVNILLKSFLYIVAINKFTTSILFPLLVLKG